MCFHCEYSENYPVFVGNIEKCPLLLGKLMVSSKGWREMPVINNPQLSCGRKLYLFTVHHPPLLGYAANIKPSSENGFSAKQQEILAQAEHWKSQEYFVYFKIYNGKDWGKKSAVRRKAIFSDWHNK